MLQAQKAPSSPSHSPSRLHVNKGLGCLQSVLPMNLRLQLGSNAAACHPFPHQQLHTAHIAMPVTTRPSSMHLRIYTCAYLFEGQGPNSRRRLVSSTESCQLVVPRLPSEDKSSVITTVLSDKASASTTWKISGSKCDGRAGGRG